MLEAIDVDEAGAVFLPVAQTMLRRLKMELNARGTDYGRKETVTPDGVGRITVRTRRGYPGAGRAQIPFSPDGKIDDWYDYIRIETCKNRMGFLVFGDDAFQTAPWAAYYVDGVVARIPPLDGSPNPDPTTSSRIKGYKLPPELRGSVFDTRNMASRYSGIMREVVGCYHIRGQNAPFSYSWAKTHGILKFDTAVADRTVTKHWLVEVSASGVFAAPIHRNEECCGSWGVQKYRPTQAQLEENPALEQYATQISLAWAFTGRPDNGVVQLIPSSEIAPIYTREPFFSGHGWAFNYSGTEAQATTQEYFVVGRHYKCSRYKLSFSYGMDQLAAGLSVVESEQPAAFRSGSVWFPTTAGEWESAKLTLTPDMFPNQSAPIHVYYDGDTEIVSRWNLTYHADVEITENARFPAPSGAFVGWGQFCFSKRSLGMHFDGFATFEIFEFVDLGSSFRDEYQAGVEAGFSSPLFSAVHDRRAYGLANDSMVLQDENVLVLEELRSGQGFCQVLVRETRTEVVPFQTRSIRNGEDFGGSSLVLFMGEREAVLSVQSNIVDETTQTLTNSTGTINKSFLLETPGINTCNLIGYESALAVDSRDWGFDQAPIDLGTVDTSSTAAVGTLAVGGAVHSADAVSNIHLDTFLHPTLNGDVLAHSAVFGMHGNLNDGGTHSATWMAGLQFHGGFTQTPGDPYQVVSFVGQV